MKRILITLTMSIIALTGMAQIKINTEEAQITLPALATKVPVTEIKKHQLPDGTIDLSASKQGDYQIKGQEFSISNHPIQSNPKFIADRKLGMENRKARYYPNDSYYEIYTTKINGCDALISRNRVDDQNSYYFFFMINDKFSSIVSGMLFYNTNEESLAKSNLDEILKGVQFK